MKSLQAFILFMALFFSFYLYARDSQVLCNRDIDGVVKITENDLLYELQAAPMMINPLKNVSGSNIFHSPQKVVRFNSHCNVRGSDSNNYSSTGLDIDIPENTIAKYSNVTIANIFTGLIKRGKGTLIIENLNISKYGGDAVNIRGSNVFIKKFTASKNSPVKPYAILTVDSSIKYNQKKLQQVLYDIDEYIKPSDIKKLTFTKSHNNMYKSEAAHVDTGIQAYEEIYIRVCDTDSNDRCIIDKNGLIKNNPVRTVCKSHYLPNKIFKKKILPTGVIYEMARVLRERNRVDKSQSDIVDDILSSIYRSGFKRKLSKDDPTLIESFEIYVDDSENIFDIKIDRDTYQYQFEKKEFNKQSYDLRSGNDREEYRICSIENIVIPNFKVSTKHRLSQVIALTDDNDFNNFQIGTESLEIDSVYRYWFKASSLRNSQIGIKNKEAILKCNINNLIRPQSTGLYVGKHLYSNYKPQGKGTKCAKNNKPSFFQGLGVDIRNGTAIGVEDTCNVELRGIENKNFDGEKIVMLEVKNPAGEVISRESKKILGVSYVNDLRKEHNKYPSNTPALPCWTP